MNLHLYKEHMLTIEKGNCMQNMKGERTNGNQMENV